ncbi:MAG TPA: FAD-binding protein [Candidatus Lokiarchaeia archaeon]|nr:FAD-binding protein [Candidatus Lokiarchaeia archaeon]
MELPTPACTSLHDESLLLIYVNDDLVTIPVFKARAAVIGSGAAGLNAAVHLAGAGLSPDKIAIITDSWGGGTSCNAGSDKQTYYKLSLAGTGMDSPVAMARDLFRGGSIHGDIALAEAAGSVEEFFHLIQLGVRFPRTEHGLYPEYQTDNDVRQRATSTGPYTSREMATCLANEVNRLGIPVLDKHLCTKLCLDESGENSGVIGVMCIDFSKIPDYQDRIGSWNDIPFNVIIAPVVVLATGGPANIFQHSAYPVDHRCAHGLGIEASASLQNVAFMQYGIASSTFRWNLSGSFQQVIPSYWVEGEEAGENVEILHDWLPSMADLAFQTFLKGYNWPFDPAKCNTRAPNHSSIIDLAIHDATVNRGKTVYMDFRENPWDLTGDEFMLEAMPAECNEYLEAAGAMQNTPIERLEVLNPFAIQVYKDHGIDLAKEPIQVHVAVQHCNGGFAGDMNWESIDVKGMYPVGEANGSHGQRRPGGAALNAGQVGGLRAARHAVSQARSMPRVSKIEPIILRELENFLGSVVLGDSGDQASTTLEEARTSIEARMSSAGGIIRWPSTLESAADEAKMMVDAIHGGVHVSTWSDLLEYFRIRDAALSHWVILSAMAEQARSQPLINPCYLVGEDSRNILDNLHDTNSRDPLMEDNRILVTMVRGGEIHHHWEDARPVPDTEEPFEALLQRSG